MQFHVHILKTCRARKMNQVSFGIVGGRILRDVFQRVGILRRHDTALEPKQTVPILQPIGVDRLFQHVDAQGIVTHDRFAQRNAATGFEHTKKLPECGGLVPYVSQDSTRDNNIDRFVFQLVQLVSRARVKRTLFQHAALLRKLLSMLQHGFRHIGKDYPQRRPGVVNGAECNQAIASADIQECHVRFNLAALQNAVGEPLGLRTDDTERRSIAAMTMVQQPIRPDIGLRKICIVIQCIHAMSVVMIYSLKESVLCPVQ